MIITRQLEEEIKQFLDNYWKLYLEGDLQTWSTYMTDDYKNIGTTQQEIWNSKQEIMNYTESVIDEMAGNAELRNKNTQVFPLGPFILAHEFGDIYIKMENEWVFYSKLRLSSIIRKSGEGWQVVHQHGSYPDVKTELGETFAFERISKENLELREAIKRRTIELENKTRELEIETALEKVRSTALAMRQPADMVEICQVISSQLESLNVNNIRNVQTAIFYPAKGTYFNYEYYARHDKRLVTEVDYRSHELQELFANQMQQGAGELTTYLLKGKELKDWYEYQKTTNQFVDVYLETAHSLTYYWYSLGPVALGISTYFPLNEAEIKLFKHFRNVFDLAYRRFMDIQQAEAQALRAEQDLIAIKVARQKAEDALAELKATQAQLIQSEKMASLGELTAGIAHEIQNPLNFVNNFSEVSIELIDELKQESAVSGRQSVVGGQQSAIEILDDIRENLQKINHHGRRADAIVKGMLQHSRTSTGQKELTDVNELADEYLRLAFHGLRAKDKSFNATMNTDFDETIGKINIVPQDISRVLLNLINNAFYAVNTRLVETLHATSLQATSLLNANDAAGKYEPTVTVSTRKSGNSVLISVKDNGNGIPLKILDKIFQPFFTTKPTGQGTGLGLSLSYDIIKAHGGSLDVESKENEFTAFTILIPV